MVEIILVTHGDYGKAMLQSAEMIIGTQEHATTLGLYSSESPDKLRVDLEEKIAEKKKTADVLVLTDLFFGSPFNVSASLMGSQTFHHITGISLPILIEALSAQESESVEGICAMLVEKGKSAVVDVNKYFEEA
ncbi:MAG: PTS sugar transporter subunit IIA [Clostridia bacterium]|nr:PTS sugar transporter subunit IIA [Clostridia bacterium]